MDASAVLMKLKWFDVACFDRYMETYFLYIWSIYTYISAHLWTTNDRPKQKNKHKRLPRKQGRMADKQQDRKQTSTLAIHKYIPTHAY